MNLFHKLSDLADKAEKFYALQTAPKMDFINSCDFDGLTEKAINKEWKKYIINTCDLVTYLANWWLVMITSAIGIAI